MASWDWKHDKDPHKVVPVGFHDPVNQYTVVGFCSPAGREVTKLMVYIKYDGNTSEYSTTRNYMSVVRDYILATPHADFVRQFVCGMHVRGT